MFIVTLNRMLNTAAKQVNSKLDFLENQVKDYLDKYSALLVEQLKAKN